MSDSLGMLVAAIGTVDGIEFTLSNETDQDVTVSLFVTPVTSECVNVFAPQLTVAPISFSDRWSDSPYSLQYLYAAPPGVYFAFVQPITGPPYKVGINLVVTAGSSVGGGPRATHHNLSDIPESESEPQGPPGKFVVDPDYLNQEYVELVDSVPGGLPAGSP